MSEQRTVATGRITPHALDVLRARIGVPIPMLRPSYEFVTVDAIRNYTRGMGDINPMFADADYARASVWGSFAAHPTLILYLGVSSEDSIPGESLQRTGKGDPLAGVHAFYAGEEIEWYRRLEEGDRLTVRGGLAKVELRESSMGGESVHEVRDYVLRDQRDRLVGVRRERRIRLERRKARDRAADRTRSDIPHVYSDDEWAAIEAAYDAEQWRGAVPRYWEDVKVEDVLPTVVKGPWTVTSYICFAEGTPARNEFHRAHSVAHEYRRSHPRAFTPTPYGFPDTIARVHWDSDMARRTGLPDVYDMGGERIAWVEQAITNWMGDAGFLRRLATKIQKFCYLGDTVWVTGKVVATRKENGEHLVDLDLVATNQRGEAVASADATVLLPSRTRPDQAPELSPPHGAVSIFE